MPSGKASFGMLMVIPCLEKTALCPAAVPDTLKLAVDEYLCPAAVPDRAVLTSCPENECVCVG